MFWTFRRINWSYPRAVRISRQYFKKTRANIRLWSWEALLCTRCKVCVSTCTSVRWKCKRAVWVHFWKWPENCKSKVSRRTDQISRKSYLFFISFFFSGLSEKTVSNDQTKTKPNFNYVPIKSETVDSDNVKLEAVSELPVSKPGLS